MAHKGEINTCPNCGANLGSFVGKCPECGHEIIGVGSNSSAREFLAKLEVIKNKERKLLDSDVEEVTALIQNFPIPNTKDDFIEFGTLCLTGMKANDLYSKAWVSKSFQIVAKGQMLFGNDPDVKNLIAQLQEGAKAHNKSNRKGLMIALGIFIGIIAACSIPLVISSHNEDKYIKEKLEQINQLPTPNKDNYLECYREFSKIQWDEDTTRSFKDGYRAFRDAQKSYREILRMAYINAEVPENLWPAELKTKSKSIADRFKDELEGLQDINITD